MGAVVGSTTLEVAMEIVAVGIAEAVTAAAATVAVGTAEAATVAVGIAEAATVEAVIAVVGDR
jgi:hypothetical protein